MTATSPLIFGEVLFDCFPDGREVLGGAPFNVAWNLQALGLAPRLVSRVGRDERGDRIASAMTHWGMDTAHLQRDAQHATGTVSVRIAGGEPNYTIEPDAAWDFIAADAPAERGGLLYHGTLALRSPGSREALRGFANTDRFVDVNLRDPWWDRASAREMLRGARWAKLNEFELDELAPAGDNRAERAGALIAEAGLEALVVTRGAEGAELHRSGEPPLVRPAAAAAMVVDTVGAGDAFSAVVLAGLLLGWRWERILDRAQALAGAVVGLRGATSTDPDFYSTFTASWELR